MKTFKEMLAHHTPVNNVNIPMENRWRMKEQLGIVQTFKEFHLLESVEKLRKKLQINKTVGSTGLSEKDGKWYGWSHRAVFGFAIGDKIFEADFGDGGTHFAKHGSKTCKTEDDCKLAAKRFSAYVS